MSLTPGLKNTHFKREQVLEAFTDPYTLLLFLLAFFQTLVVGGINTFNALLLNKAFGFSVLDSQLLSIPLGAMTIVTYMLISYLITKTNQTLLTMIGFTIPNIIGSIVLLTVAPADKTRGGLVVAFYCMQVFQAVNPAIFLMLSRNSAGQTKKSVTYAVTYIGKLSAACRADSRLGGRQRVRAPTLPGPLGAALHHLAVHPPCAL